MIDFGIKIGKEIEREIDLSEKQQGILPLLVLLWALLLAAMPSAVLAEEADTTIPATHQLNLKDMQGTPMSLHDFAGKKQWLVVMVWQSDCHVCNQEAGNYEAWQQKRKSDGIKLLGITTDGWDNKDAAQGFIDRHKVTFTNALVEYGDLDAYYQLNIGKSFFGTPAFLIFSPQGEILAEQVGAVPVDLIDNFIKEKTQSAKSGAAPSERTAQTES